MRELLSPRRWTNLVGEDLCSEIFELKLELLGLAAEENLDHDGCLERDRGRDGGGHDGGKSGWPEQPAQGGRESEGEVEERATRKGGRE